MERWLEQSREVVLINNWVQLLRAIECLKVTIQFTALKILKKVLDRFFGKILSSPPQLAPAYFLHPKEPLRSHAAN